MGGLNSLNFLGPPKLGVGGPPLVETCHWSMGLVGEASLVRRTPPPSRLASSQLARSLRSQRSFRIVTLVLLLRFCHVRASFGDFVDVLPMFLLVWINSTSRWMIPALDYSFSWIFPSDLRRCARGLCVNVIWRLSVVWRV